MKRAGVLTILALLSVLIALYILARVRIDSYRTDYVYRLHAAASPLPNIALEALAGEFKGMVANYLFLEAASFIGGKQDASEKDWNAVARLLDQSSYLDPYFKQTYRLTQSSLPWQAKRPDKAIPILERSKKHLSWDWEPGFFIGFDYFYFFKDNLKASRELMEASRVPDAPIALATLASRLASKAGQTRAAIDFLTAIYEKTSDKETRELLKNRIVALNGVELLSDAVERFQKRFQRLPDTLTELVDKGIISALPANPYNRPFSLNNDRVDF